MDLAELFGGQNPGILNQPMLPLALSLLLAGRKQPVSNRPNALIMAGLDRSLESQQIQQRRGQLQQAGNLFAGVPHEDALRALMGASPQAAVGLYGDTQQEAARQRGAALAEQYGSRIDQMSPQEMLTLSGNPNLPESFRSALRARANYQPPKGPERWSEPYQLGGATVIQNLDTHKVVTAVSRPPTTSVHITNSPDSTIKPQDSEKIIHPMTGAHPPLGMTYGEAQAKGYVVATTGEQAVQIGAKGAKATLARMDELTGKLWPGAGGGDTGVWNRMQKMGDWSYAKAAQTDPNLVAFDSFSRGTLAPLIRAVGEKGNLANQDIERAIQLIPSTGGMGGLPDTNEVAHLKMKQLNQWFERATSLADQKTGGGSGALTPAEESELARLKAKHGIR